MSPQLAFELPHVPALGGEDFYVSASNAQAAKLISAWPDWTNPISIVSGPQGTGKTHLVNVWRARSGATCYAADDLEAAVVRAVSEPGGVLKGFGAPERGEVQKIYCTDKLTIINVIWAPRMTIMPHNHNMWAVIGVYGGREDNIFWRRIKDDPSGKIEAAGAKSLGQELAGSRAFAQCQVTKVFRTVCLRDPVDGFDRDEIRDMTDDFGPVYGYDLKEIFAASAGYCVN